MGAMSLLWAVVAQAAIAVFLFSLAMNATPWLRPWILTSIAVPVAIIIWSAATR